MQQPNTSQPKHEPYVCPECSGETYYGILRFVGDPIPTCPNHRDPVTGEDKVVELVPAQ